LTTFIIENKLDFETALFYKNLNNI